MTRNFNGGTHGIDGERYERDRADSDLKSDIKEIDRGLDATKDELREARSEITELSSTVADLTRRLAALESTDWVNKVGAPKK